MHHSTRSRWVIPLVILASIAGLASLMTASAQAQIIPGSKLDLTSNQVIDAADARSVGDAWRSLQQVQQCIAPAFASRDINGDGCVDVADVQLTLAHWGEPADPGQPLPNPDAPAIAAEAASFTVDSAGDQHDANKGDGVCSTSDGHCTLRAAIEQANQRRGPEAILFNIRNADGSCPAVVTIKPGSNMIIDDPYNDGVMIDGYSQCGAVPNTLAVGGNAQIKIEIKGSDTDNINGLEIHSSNNVVRGLALYRSDFQIMIVGPGSNNRIVGNFIGTDAAQAYSEPRSWVSQRREGIQMEYGANDNVIGGTAPADRNIISGNGIYGVVFWVQVFRNRVIGNYIGLRQDGVTPLPNKDKGLDVDFGAQSNWIGGPNPGEGNIISGNTEQGMEISHGADTQFNTIAGNYFGLDASGTRVIGNGERNGFSFEDTVDSNYAYNNVVVGSGANGVYFFVLASRNEVHNNLIGVAPDGVTPMPNGTNPNTGEYRNGITMMGGSHNNIIRNNVIANSPENGIVLSNTSDNVHHRYGTTFYNTISQNSIYNNGPAHTTLNNIGQGILLLGKPAPTSGQVTYANQDLPAPQISSASAALVTGISQKHGGQPCAGCTIEVFIADRTSLDASSEWSNYGEGKTFIGNAVSDSAGNFAVPINGAQLGQLITATCTDELGNTSSFSRNMAVGQAAPPPTPIPTPIPPVPTPPVGGAPQYHIRLPVMLKRA